MSVCTTQGITVTVFPHYLPDESAPDESKWIFAYRITICNQGDQPALLVDRHWFITDGLLRVHEVAGPGVVGQTPYLEPGDAFTYTSFCPLSTDYGVMKGTYGMERPDGQRFEVEIAPFALLPHWMLN